MIVCRTKCPALIYECRTYNIFLSDSVRYRTVFSVPDYMQLSSELKWLYPNFLFEIVPVVLGATGLVTSDLQKNPEKLGISSINDMLAKCQQMALLGTMKIVKSFMRMKND